MKQLFEHGYAVVIGIDDNNIKELALPTVTKDVQAVYDVLLHPERCAYKPKNVRRLKGEESTRTNILGALDWLREIARNDREATAVVYYSGHGGLIEGHYYLIPYDIRYGSISGDAIKAEEFSERIGDICTRRILVVLDCCHAAGMEIKEVGQELPERGIGIDAAAFPIDIIAGDVPDFKRIKSGSKGMNDATALLNGEGRAILNSSGNTQSSYIRKDGRMSLFTYHLIEALTGHAPHNDDDTTVLVTDVMSWVTRKVEDSAREQGRDQTPVMRTTGVFPVALLIGGKGLAKRTGETPPSPLAKLPPVTFNQQGQTVHGPQINAADDVNINHLGDVVHGDQIAVGNIYGGGGVVIGRDAHLIVNSPTITGEAVSVNAIFTPLQSLIATQAPGLVGKISELQAQVARGAAADDIIVAGLIDDLARNVPDANDLLRNLMAHPEAADAARGVATKFVLSRLD